MKYQFMRFPGGRAKAFTMSYDDGCQTDIRFSDTITPYGLKCTFNLTGCKILSDDVIREKILDRGHEIAVHGQWHRAPGEVRPIEAIQDVVNCRLDLEKRFGGIVRGMAYPDTGITRWENNSDYDTVKRYLTDLDIAYARTLGGDNDSFLMPDDWHAWMPTARHANPRLMEYLDEFLQLDPGERPDSSHCGPRLFYLWGHSFEFEWDNGWELLTRICEKISGHEDIWYAGNTEIYNYWEAYQALQYSADGDTIYNPTLYQLYFFRDGKNYTIHSGETLRISD